LCSKRSDIQGIIKQKKKINSFKKKNEIGLGKLQAHTGRRVCIYIFINIAKVQKRGSAGLARGAACWCCAK